VRTNVSVGSQNDSLGHSSVLMHGLMADYNTLINCSGSVANASMRIQMQIFGLFPEKAAVKSTDVNQIKRCTSQVLNNDFRTYASFMPPFFVYS